MSNYAQSIRFAHGAGSSPQMTAKWLSLATTSILGQPPSRLTGRRFSEPGLLSRVYWGMVELMGSSFFSSGLPDSCSLTRSINASVELPDGLLDNDPSRGMTIVASKSGSTGVFGSTGNSAGISLGNSSGNSASISAGSSSGIGKESVNSISIDGKGGMLSSSNIESLAGMGADPSGAAAGFVTGLSPFELAIPGIGAEPSDAVGGL